REEGTDEERLNAMRWYSQAIADLLTSLNDVPDGPSSTLLDNTIVVVISKIRHASHSADNLPLLIFGRPGGALNVGNHVSYRPGGRPLGDLWRTMLNVMGVPATSFGWNRPDPPGLPQRQ